MRRTHNEYSESAQPPIAEIRPAIDLRRFGPGADPPLFIGLDNASNAVQIANLNGPV